MNNIIIGYLLVAIVAFINCAPQYTWEDLKKNVKTLPSDTRQMEMNYNRHLTRQHSEPASHELHGKMMMNPSNESNNSEQKHHNTLRILSSNESGKSDSKSMEYYRHDHVHTDEDFVAPMIRQDTRSKHDVKQNVMDFLSGQQNFDEKPAMQEDYLTRTVLEELLRSGIQTNYNSNEHGPRFMTVAPKMEELSKAIQPQRLPTEDRKYVDMTKGMVKMTSDLMNAANTEKMALSEREANTLHSIKTMRNSQENQMDTGAMMLPSNLQDQTRMPTTNMEDRSESNNNRSSQEQTQNQRQQNMMVENKMRPRNQKQTMSNNGHANTEQMMNTIYRN